MYSNIISNIICSQFDVTYGRSAGLPTHSATDKAMQVTFSLGIDYKKEDGYRHLQLLIFGGGSNYIGVYGKLDWTVVALDDLEYDAKEGENYVKKGKDYIKGETPWVLLGYHDSCWRDTVRSEIDKHEISTIDSLFNGKTGWYKELTLTPEQIKELNQIRMNTPGYGNNIPMDAKRVHLKDLNFKFEGTLAHE